MFEKVDYAALNSRQKENFNFHLIAARLALFGYHSLRLTDDFEGADFIALHIDGSTMLRVQLKGRLTFDAKYYGKDIHIAFREPDKIYVYPHDTLREEMVAAGHLVGSRSERWIAEGSRTWPKVPKKYRSLLEKYEI